MVKEIQWSKHAEESLLKYQIFDTRQSPDKLMDLFR